MYTKVVDSTNTNLIENGSIDPEYIEVEGDFSNPSFRFVPEDDFSNSNLFNTLQLSIPYTTNFQYTLLFDNIGSVTIDFIAEFTESICDTTYYVPKKAVINNLEVEIIEVRPLSYMLVIVM